MSIFSWFHSLIFILLLFVAVQQCRRALRWLLSTEQNDGGRVGRVENLSPTHPSDLGPEEPVPSNGMNSPHRVRSRTCAWSAPVRPVHSSSRVLVPRPRCRSCVLGRAAIYWDSRLLRWCCWTAQKGVWQETPEPQVAGSWLHQTLPTRLPYVHDDDHAQGSLIEKRRLCWNFKAIWGLGTEKKSVAIPARQAT